MTTSKKKKKNLSIDILDESDFTEVLVLYKEAFVRTKHLESKEIYKIASGLYDACDQQYEYCLKENDAKQQFRICQMIDEEILLKLAKAISNCRETALANKLFVLHKKFLALSARRNLKNFALYIESYKNKKVWDKTLDTVRSVFYYADRFVISDTFNLLRVSLMPSMGKSYIGNLFTAQEIGNDPNIQILRITYSDDLCISTTRQTAGIINSQAFREIFPRYKKYPGNSIFKSQTSYSLCIVDCEDEYNLNAVTREG